MNVFIIGFMGSGKSTLGKKIAARLKFDFLDLDSEIERLEKKTIAQLFSEKGEIYFRETETNWLKNFNNQSTVIATGGGTPCTGNNFELMKEKGVTVYLESSAENLTNRLYQSKNVRPLIDSIKDDKNQLLNFVRAKLNEREKFYGKCDITFDSIDVDAGKLDKLVSQILKSHSE